LNNKIYNYYFFLHIFRNNVTFLGNLGGNKLYNNEEGGVGYTICHKTYNN